MRDKYELARNNENNVEASYINLHNGFIDKPILPVIQPVSEKYIEKMIQEAKNKTLLGLNNVS